jgi:hypothetical protein
MIVATLLTGVVSAAAADEVSDDLEVFAVDAGRRARVLFAAPSDLATRTLTADDLDVRVDGAPRNARLQRLSASDLEVAVVVDTTLEADAVREVQAAIVELALTLPQGAIMRLIDAAGNTTDTAPVPGPAIAAIRSLRAGTDDAIAAAVDQATTLLDDSARGRSALVVVGRDLSTRLETIDDRPLNSLSYLIDIGGGRAASLLGPGAGGKAVTVDAVGGVLAVTDEIAQDLRALYLAEFPLPEGDARTVTFALATEDGDTQPLRLTLEPDARQPAAPDRGAQAASGEVPDAPATPVTLEGRLPWLIGVTAIAAIVAALALVLPRMLRRAETAVPVPVVPPLPQAPRRQRPASESSPPQRPIAKLTPDTRQALAGAYRGLRRLALTSREMVGIVPDDLFRVAEASASAALSGHDRPLPAALRAALANNAGDPDSAMIHRAATAVLTGWQHTARRQSGPPAVVEINALLRGLPASQDRRRTGPVAPVRALDPLVEIGLEHVVLAAQPDEHAALVARAVTVVDVMRAARLAQPVLALSPFLLDHADRYRAACSSNPTDAAARDNWLTLFFEGVAQRAYVAVEQLGRMRSLRDRYRHAAWDTASAQLVDLLLSRPVIDIPLITRRLVMSPERAEMVRAAAERAGWLEPYPGDPRVWVAAGVVEVFATTTDALADAHRRTG